MEILLMRHLAVVIALLPCCRPTTNGTAVTSKMEPPTVTDALPPPSAASDDKSPLYLGCSGATSLRTPAVIPLSASPRPGQAIYLRVEGLTATKLTSGYAIHLNETNEVGQLNVYGVIEAGPRGIVQTFRVTDTVNALRASGQWNASRADVMFVPTPYVTGKVAAGDESGDERVQRICLISAKEE